MYPSIHPLVRPATLAFCVLTLLASCKKEDSATTTPADPNAAPAEVPVLRDGAGFTQGINMLLQVNTGVNNSAGSLGVYDFSVDNNNQLNLLYFTGFQSQQDYLKMSHRAVYNLSTKAAVTLEDPDKMLANNGKQGYETQVFEFLPYSEKVVAFTTSGYLPGYYSQAFWGASIPRTDMEMGHSSAGAGYTGGAGFYNVYTDLGDTKHYMTVNLNPASTIPLIWGNIPYRSPAHALSNLANFPEPRYTNQGDPAIITVCKDSVVAYRFTYGTSGAYTQTGFITPAGFSNSEQYKTQRHYSKDGTKMAMLVRGETSGHYWTYTYNFTTNTLAAGLSNTDLPYSGVGTDLDLDDDGNIYYTGTSGNGAGKGVSIYKRSPGSTTLVGTDDFLKFGEVSKLHVINGKVHIIVKGMVTGHAPWGQVSWITQQ